MARYLVKGPDGATHEFDGPENATPDQVVKAATEYFDPINQSARNFAADMPLSDRRGFGQIAAGVGQAASSVGRGVGQLARAALPDRIGDAIGLPTQQSIDEAQRLDAPLLKTTGGMTGSVLGNVGMIALPAAGMARVAQAAGMARTATAANALVNPATFAGAAGAGATVGALQPVATGDSRAQNATMGALAGAAGQGLVKGAGALLQPVKNALDPLAQKAVDTLRSAGVPLDLAQQTGSAIWNRVRSSLSDNPFTMGSQAAAQDAQRNAFTSAALKVAGADAKAATPDVMAGIRDKANATIGDILSRNSVTLAPKTATRLADIHAAALENEKAPVVSLINRFFKAADPQTGEVSGQVAYTIKKDLDTMAASSDSTLAKFARDARSAVMDGINDGLSGADQKAFAEARGNMANMFKLEPAISKDGLGTISAARLANSLGTKSNRMASVYGKGPQELVDLAQAGKQLLPDGLPNSGTAARAWMQAVGPGAIVGLGTGLSTGDWTKAAEYGAGTVALPKAAQFALNSPTVINALTNGVQSPLGRNALELIQRNALANQATRALPTLAGRTWLLPASQ